MLLSTFFGFRRSKWRPYEIAVLDTVASRLSPSAVVVFQRQLEEINSIQRLTKDKEVNLYRVRRQVPYLPQENRFRNQLEDIALARLHLHGSLSPAQIRAYIWMTKGLIQSLTFSESPLPGLSSEVMVQDCLVLVDPTTQITRGATRSRQIASYEYLATLYNAGVISCIVDPLEPAEQRGFVQRWKQYLPDDYSRLLSESNGFVFNEWHFLGAFPRYIVQAQRNLLLFAEKPDTGCLCTIEGEQDVHIYYCDYERFELQRLDRLFMSSLIRVATAETV